MSYEVRWEAPQRVIYQRFYDVVTIQDMEEAQAKVIEMIAENGGSAHTIVDLLEVGRYPRNLMEIREALHIRTGNERGWVLIVNRNPLLGFVSTVVTRLAMQNTRYRVFETVDQAHNFLAEQAKQDESLNPNTENTP